MKKHKFGLSILVFSILFLCFLSISVSALNTTGLQIYYKFDETAGTTAADSSGFNHLGSLSGSTTWIAGKKNNSLQFNGNILFLFHIMLEPSFSFTICSINFIHDDIPTILVYKFNF